MMFVASYRPIKRKIMLSFVALLVIPLLLISVFTYLETSNMIESKSIRQLQTVSMYANQQFDQYVSDIENLSVNILENAKLQSSLKTPYKPPKDWKVRDVDNENEIRLFLNGIYKLKPGISSILIYGFNGQQFYYHPVRRWDEAFDGTAQDWYKQTVGLDGRWSLSGKREEKQLFSTLDASSEPVVTFSRVIKDLDTFRPIGVLAVNIKLTMLETLAGVNQLTDRLLVLDRNGVPLLTSEGVPGGQVDGRWLEASAESRYTGWTTKYLISRRELFRESREIRNFIVIAALLLLMASLMMASALSSGIVKPLLRLKKKMKEVEKGEFVVEDSPVPRDEVGELTVGFNRMVERIAQMAEDIRKRESLRMQTEMNALQARINPHFMYNTLNGIRWVAMMAGDRRAADMIASLVQLLQFSAKNTDSLIPVAKELDMLRHYVALMRMRNDQFDFELEADDAVRGRLIVPFLLQPIVENAIFHGIIPLEARGSIRVQLYEENGRNVAVVRDDGVGMTPEAIARLLQHDQVKKAGAGSFNKIGMANVFDRLKLQFGASAAMNIRSEPGRGTEVRIQWPILLPEEGVSS